MSAEVRSGAVLAAGQFCLRGAAALYMLLLVRAMEPEAFGEVSFRLALLGILVIVADGGLSRILIRDVARDPSDMNRLLDGVMRLRALWAVAIAAALVTSGLALGTPAAPMALMALVLVLEAAATGFEAAAVGAQRSGIVAGGQSIGALILLGASAVVIGSEDVTINAGIGAFAGAAAGKLAWHLCHARDVFRQPPATQTQRRAWLFAGAPFLALAVLGAIYYRIDMVILYSLSGAAEAAPYAAAYRFVDAVLVLAGVLAATVAPRFSRLHRDDPRAVAQRWRQLVLSSVVVGLVPVLAVCIFAHPLAEILFGARYRAEAGELLRILAPGVLFMVLQTISAAVLFTSDLQRTLLRLSLVPVVGNVALTITLVAAADAVGAAIATTVAEVGTFAYYAVFIRKRFGPPAAPGAQVAESC